MFLRPPPEHDLPVLVHLEGGGDVAVVDSPLKIFFTLLL